MGILANWRKLAYETQRTPQDEEKFWAGYFTLEQGFYKKLLASDEVISGSVADLAKQFDVSVMVMTGIIDGIDDSLVTKNPIDEMEEDTVVSFDYDKELLYKNMVAAKAEWLYTLPEWERHLTKERQNELYKEQKRSTTIVKPAKIGRNDPCPCGSGKKYKHCCGK